jgi:O-methyltransferase
MLAAISGAESVLELGTFTGYSALCLAEGVVKGKKEKMKKRDLIEETTVELNKDVESKEKAMIEGGKGNEEVTVETLDLNRESTSEQITENEKLEDVIISTFSVRKLEKLQKRKVILEKIENKKQKIEHQKLENIEKLNPIIIENDVVVSVVEKRERRGSVVTCEMDPSAANIALEFFQMSELGEEV